MIALHGAWSPTGRLALWTEDPALCVGGVPTAAHDGETPTLHPFCGPTEGIAEWLERDDIDVEQDDICLLLPSTANGPSPSPSLWLDVDDLPPEADRLRPWTVLACLVDADKAGGVLDLLTDTLPVGHVAADDLRALTAMARFARTLVARGQIRPILMKGFEGWEARWTPRVSHPADATVRRAFIENLPPVLRGAGALRAGDAPWDDAIVPDRAEVVDGVMRAITDALVRQKLPAKPLSPSLKSIPAWDAFAAAAVGTTRWSTSGRSACPSCAPPWRPGPARRPSPKAEVCAPPSACRSPSIRAGRGRSRSCSRRSTTPRCSCPPSRSGTTPANSSSSKAAASTARKSACWAIWAAPRACRRSSPRRSKTRTRAAAR